jgi:hypothetical protein
MCRENGGSVSCPASDAPAVIVKRPGDVAVLLSNTFRLTCATSPVFLNASRSIEIPQYRPHRPDKSLFNTVCLALNDSDEVLGQSHADVSTNTREDVPPAMQLEKEAPWKSDVVLDSGDIAAEVKVDTPEKVAKQEVC